MNAKLSTNHNKVQWLSFLSLIERFVLEGWNFVVLLEQKERKDDKK